MFLQKASVSNALAWPTSGVWMAGLRSRSLADRSQHPAMTELKIGGRTSQQRIHHNQLTPAPKFRHHQGV
jgi:hypothetical protein